MQYYPLFPIIHPVLKTAFPQCLWQGNPQQNEIALTFDDGPNPQYTPELLNVLDDYQIPASFFWLGCCVDRYPQIAREIYQRGHWIGLHGYQHYSFPVLTLPQIQDSLIKTQTAITNACNLEANSVLDIRPPNGLFTPKILTALQQWNYRPVMWSVVPEDWVHPGVDKVVKRVINKTVSGSIIVLHDGNCGGRDVARSAAKIIPKLLEKGYKFVTINKLWQHH
ncbi:MAG: polysaccharide deacetylase family protein [Microcoleaceae cyanobacterium]